MLVMLVAHSSSARRLPTISCSILNRVATTVCAILVGVRSTALREYLYRTIEFLVLFRTRTRRSILSLATRSPFYRALSWLRQCSVTTPPGNGVCSAATRPLLHRLSIENPPMLGRDTVAARS